MFCELVAADRYSNFIIPKRPLNCNFFLIDNLITFFHFVFNRNCMLTWTRDSVRPILAAMSSLINTSG